MHISLFNFINIIVFLLSVVISLYFIYKLHYGFTHFKLKKNLSAPEMLHDLPSVSICIPARNETHAMTECLEHAIASTYPKLEVIVFDDSSADNTSVLIKSFAHAGVRFVEGSPLPDGWLGKNHALQNLLTEASGSYILYMDVDTLIEPQAVEELVSYMIQEEATMISVLPKRKEGFSTSGALSTLRYFWELILHSKNNPAVASSAWMIHRHSLRDALGGFEPRALNIQPEADIASILMLQNKYRFIIATRELGVNFAKQWRSQVDTSIRLLFPMLQNNILLSLGAFVLLLLSASPLILIGISIFTGWTPLSYLAIIDYVLFYISYGLYTRKVWSKNWWLGMLLWPVVTVQEAVIVIISMSKYLSHSVTWKGRPVAKGYKTS